LRLAPDDPGILNNLGNVLRSMHRPDEALGCFRRALELQPRAPGLLDNIANTLREAGRLEEALAFCERAVEELPELAGLHNTMGAILMERKLPERAAASFRRAVELQPDFAMGYLNLGLALRQHGDLAGAEAALRRVVLLAPRAARPQNELGLLLKETQRTAEAGDCFRRAIEAQPDFAEGHNNLGGVLRAQRKFDPAAECFRRALQLSPQYAEAANNLAMVLIDRLQPVEAMAACADALLTFPKSAGLRNTMGVALLRLGRVLEAMRWFREAIGLNAGFQDATCNLGTALLSLGEYREGWRGYESRRIPPELIEPGAALWRGEPIPGQTLILACEQGLGDCIQFARYLPFAAARAGAARLILECPAPLVRLFRAGVEEKIEVVKAGPLDELRITGEVRRLALLSLPWVLGMFEPTAVAAPYLRIDPAVRNAWQGRLAGTDKLRVGLVWKGNPENVEDARRSIDPAALRPLLSLPGVRFHHLHLEVAPAEQRLLGEHGVAALLAGVSDLADTAALMEQLDLVISVDSAPAHLAGALGRPVWLLLPFAPDWRWGLTGVATPWYSSMRLIRQSERGNWAPAIQEACERLGRVSRASGEERAALLSSEALF
jgi:tetratricopeptide (TPR) repeat protein